MKSNKKSIKFNLIMNMLLTTSAFVFPLITFPYISRVLQPEGNGKIAFANSIITYFSMFALLGIPTYGIRACAQVRDDKKLLSKTVQEIWIINAVTTLIAYLIFLVALFCVPRLKEERILMLVCSMSLFLNLIAMEWLYKALECYSYITMRSLAFKVLAVILMFLLVKKKDDYVIYAGITVLANTGYGIFNFLNLKRHIAFEHFLSYDIKRHLKPVLIFFAMSVAVTIYSNLDITMLGFMRDDTEVGYYDVAIKIKVILVNVVTSLGAVLLPRTSYYIEKKLEKEFWAVSAKALEFVTALSIPLTMGFIVMSKQCILLLSGEAYLPSVLPMCIIMPTLILIGASNVLGIQMLVPLGKEQIVLYSEVTGAIVDVILNAILIPQYGASGAAVGTLIAELVVLGVQIATLKTEALVVIKKVQIAKIGVAVFMATVFLVFVRDNINLTLFPLLTVSFGGYIFIYGGILLVLKETVVSEVAKTIRGKILNIVGFRD